MKESVYVIKENEKNFLCFFHVDSRHQNFYTLTPKILGGELIMCTWFMSTWIMSTWFM